MIPCLRAEQKETFVLDGENIGPIAQCTYVCSHNKWQLPLTSLLESSLQRSAMGLAAAKANRAGTVLDATLAQEVAVNPLHQ